MESSNLKPPEIRVVSFEVDEHASFPIIKVNKDNAADISYYKACIAQDIRCKKGFIVHAPHIVPIENPGTYYFEAYSCIWQDRTHQKIGSQNVTLESLGDQKMYCSRPSQQVSFTFQRQPRDSVILQKVKDYDLARSKFHKSLIDFRNILKNYQENASSPPLSLLSQILNVLYLRDNLHSIVGNEFFNHSIYFTYRLAHRYNHLASSLPISANMIRNCASNNIINHMQARTIPGDPYDYQNLNLDIAEDTSAASTSLTGEKLSLMSEATALAMLASGGATSATKENFKTLQYQVLNYHFSNYAQSPEQSPILFGVGVAFTTTTAMEIQRQKKDAATLAGNLEEVNFYQELNTWAESFISVRHEYLRLKKELHVDQMVIN